MDPYEEEIIVVRLDSADPEELKALYQAAGWWDSSCDRNPDFLNCIVSGSAVFAGAFDKKKLVGMGRALSDLSSDAYIQDVTVLRAYRGKGLGARIIRFLVAELKKNGVDWIGLIAEPGTSSFYENLGFHVMNGYIPLKYKDI